MVNRNKFENIENISREGSWQYSENIERRFKK